MIGNFNPPWDAQGGNDAAFFQAVGVAGMILDNKLERYRGNERADKRVEEILKQHQEEIASGKSRRMKSRFWCCRIMFRARNIFPRQTLHS